MIRVSRDECLLMVKQVMQRDAISLGISSAANLVAVSKLAPRLKPRADVLTVIYDDVDSYPSYFQ